MDRIIVSSKNYLGSKVLRDYIGRLKKLPVKERIVFKTMYSFKVLQDSPRVVLEFGLKNKFLSPESASNVIIEGLTKDGLTEGVDYEVRVKYDN